MPLPRTHWPSGAPGRALQCDTWMTWASHGVVKHDGPLVLLVEPPQPPRRLGRPVIRGHHVAIAVIGMARRAGAIGDDPLGARGQLDDPVILVVLPVRFSLMRSHSPVRSTWASSCAPILGYQRQG